MNKKVLVITPFFAPESHAAVFRAHKLVKYLKRLGWEPYVLTVDKNYVYKEDPDLLKELEGIPIYRSRYIEPSLRGLKMALGGKNRTFRTLQSQEVIEALNEEKQLSKKGIKLPFFKKAYDYMLNNHLQNPDRYWTWKRSAIKQARKIIKKEGIEIIYTTCLPFTSNEIGISLKRSMGVKWVADFRDPITYAKKLHSANYRVFSQQRKIQDQTFKFADRIVGLSSAYTLIFHDQYQGLFDDKIHFIPTGLDDDYIPTKISAKDNTLLFIGEYLQDYGDHFFQLFKSAITEVPEDQIPKIVIIGRKDINQRVVMPFLKNLDIARHVIFHDHMPQKELYKIVEKSRFVLLINGVRAHWWNNFAKLVDYIALKKQVIAFIPAISEARSELTMAGLGIFLKFDKKSEETFKELLISPDKNITENHNYCEKYLASSQTNSFITIFKSL